MGTNNADMETYAKETPTEEVVVEEVNPLADFNNEEILAEIARRLKK